MSSPRVFFLNRFYWPDEPATAQLLSDLAPALVRRGHTVTVISGFPEKSGSPRTEVREGVTIERVKTWRGSRHNLVARVLAFLCYFPAALWRLRQLLRPGDAVVALTDPPLIGVAAWLATRSRNAHLYHWVQDIYPEVAAELSSQHWPLVLRPVRDRAWKSACACFVPGTDMAATLARAGVNMETVFVTPNWAPRGLAPASVDDTQALRREWGLANLFVVAYSGNLGRVHDFEPLIEVAKVFRHDAGIAFLFVGDGAQRATLEATARAHGLRNVHFRPPQPRERLAVSLSVGDLQVVTLRPGLEACVFPSKLYGIAAVGRPVLFIGPTTSEVARLTRTRGLGAAFDRSETPAIGAWISRLRANDDERRSHQAAAIAFAEHGFAESVDTWDRGLRRERASDFVAPLFDPSQ